MNVTQKGKQSRHQRWMKEGRKGERGDQAEGGCERETRNQRWKEVRRGISRMCERPGTGEAPGSLWG